MARVHASERVDTSRERKTLLCASSPVLAGAGHPAGSTRADLPRRPCSSGQLPDVYPIVYPIVQLSMRASTRACRSPAQNPQESDERWRPPRPGRHARAQGPVLGPRLSRSVAPMSPPWTSATVVYPETCSRAYSREGIYTPETGLSGRHPSVPVELPAPCAALPRRPLQRAREKRETLRRSLLQE